MNGRGNYDYGYGYGQPAMLPYQHRQAIGAEPAPMRFSERASLFDTRGHGFGTAVAMTLFGAAIVGVGFAVGQGLASKTLFSWGGKK